MTTPLSDERLAEIGQFLESHADGRGHCDGANWRYVHSASTGLLAEVERLRTENGRLLTELLDADRYVGGAETDMEMLRARVAELEDVDNRVQAMADRMAEQAADNLLRAREAERRVVRLEGVLREVEWGADTYVYDDDGGRTIPTCPRCFSERNDGHAPDCALDAALRDKEDDDDDATE